MKTKQPSLVFDLGLLTVLRAVLQTITRMIYPFLAVFARGMGVQITAVTTALGISMLTALLGPLLAPLSDRYGRRAGILLGVSIFTLSAALVAVFPGFPTFAISLFLGNLAINIFLPAVFAFLSDRTSYDRRGFVMGIFEISWAASFLIVVPLMGVLIQNYGWQSAFTALALAGHDRDRKRDRLHPRHPSTGCCQSGRRRSPGGCLYFPQCPPADGLRVVLCDGE